MRGILPTLCTSGITGLLSPWAIAANQVEQGITTPVTNVAPGIVILSIAGALLLTLFLRVPVQRLVNAIGNAIHRRNLQRILLQHSDDVLSDFLLESPYGGLTRIDYAIRIAEGVVCIRAKRVSGKILGDLQDSQWAVDTNGRRRYFLNPVIQNEGRAETLRRLTPELPVINLVVLDGQVEFTQTSDHPVIHADQLDEYLRNVSFTPQNAGDVQTSWLNIRSAALTDAESKKDFAAQLSFG